VSYWAWNALEWGGMCAGGWELVCPGFG
jgi:hypothetical protein